MRDVQSPAAAQEWPWRQGPSAVLASFRRRWYEARFWLIQAMILTVTVVHYTVEAFPVDDSISTVHHIPVILYLIPVVYASLHYGWEGGVLTALWAGLLTVPSMAISHRSDFHWAGELGQVVVTLVVGAKLYGIRRLADEQQRAEALELVSGFDPNDGIESRGFFWFGAVMMVLFIATIATTSVLPYIQDLGMGYVAMGFAGIMLIRYKAVADKFYQAIDWDLLAFFGCLFIVINMMEHALVLEAIGTLLHPVLELGQTAGPGVLMFAAAAASSQSAACSTDRPLT
ncbi:hypothetical protein LCGC14_2413660 [marine sediment metagenome]|uniref:Citrate transporter-like domain-containing protein n=1 Tax=marine sediment metagenome TaxID=412755 RepID=A0A0F9EL39_9ZZZZ